MIKLGKYYKVNWYTEEEPQYGYFFVKDRKTCKEHRGSPYDTEVDCWIVDECNPWGGNWLDVRHPADDIHVQGAIEVKALVAMTYIYMGKISCPKEG